MANQKSILDTPIFQSADRAREYLESVRWPDGPCCPHCGDAENWKRLEGEKHRPGLFQCNACRKQFSVTVKTVFERSKIPLNKWLLAAYLMASSKKGVSAHQIHRTLGITYKSAWFMMHRLREAMTDSMIGQLGGEGTSGIVEADEMYYGKTRGGKGERLAKKQKIVALVERKGRVRAFHVPRVTVDTVGPILKGQVSKDARLMTDGAGLYEKIGKGFKTHETVNHAANEYARGDVTTNTVEGYFGILKRSLRGVYQHVSPEHLNRYVSEFSFRYNNRVSLDIDDHERTRLILAGIEGKRLTYLPTDRTHA